MECTKQFRAIKAGSHRFVVRLITGLRGQLAKGFQVTPRTKNPTATAQADTANRLIIINGRKHSHQFVGHFLNQSISNFGSVKPDMQPLAAQLEIKIFAVG